MNNKIKLLKLEHFIGKLHLYKNRLYYDKEANSFKIPDGNLPSMPKNIIEIKSLYFIFNHNNLNEYAKLVLNNTSYNITDIIKHDGGYFSPFLISLSNVFGSLDNNENNYYDIERKREFINYVKTDTEEKYKLIFWTLMVLAVDKTDIENNLSTICDIATYWNIPDEQFIDIVNLIKIIFNEETVDSIKTDSIKSRFKELIEMYK